VTTPTTIVGYTVDGRGLRQSRTVSLATEDLVWSTAGALPVLLEDGGHAYLYGPSLAPIAQVDGSGEVEYLHGDLLGSVRAITDDTGTVTGRSDFDAFGVRTAHTGTGDSLFGFTGNWTDPDTHLVHLRARDYDPGTGQFLSVDPAVDSTRQPYAYTGNNPLLRTDPSGLDWWDEARLNIMTAGSGYLDGFSFGLSNQLFDTMAPGFRDCLKERDPTLYNASSFYGTFAFDVALILGTWAVELLLAGVLSAAAKDVLVTEANAARGELTVIGSGFSASERGAAETLAAQGRNVVLREAPGTIKTSDLLVDGVPYDVYTPMAGTGARNILNNAAKKWTQVDGGGIVVDLSNTGLAASDFGNALVRINGFIRSWEGNPISDIIFLGGS
jgi:RHS repeat-associated protein